MLHGFSCAGPLPYRELGRPEALQTTEALFKYVYTHIVRHMVSHVPAGSPTES